MTQIFRHRKEDDILEPEEPHERSRKKQAAFEVRIYNSFRGLKKTLGQRFLPSPHCLPIKTIHLFIFNRVNRVCSVRPNVHSGLLRVTGKCAG